MAPWQTRVPRRRGGSVPESPPDVESVLAARNRNSYTTSMLKVGDRAPSIRGRDQHGQEIALDALTSKGPVVLYFYPKDFTRVCTQEACLFRDSHSEFQGLGAEIVGVSLDREETHKRFAEKHQLNFHLLADPDKSIARAFGVLRLETFNLFTKRATFVIDREGIIRAVLHHELSAQKHVDGVRRALAAL